VEFNLADLLEIVVDTVPERLALVAGDSRLTFRQLDERANRFAHHLIASGIEPAEHVAIYSWNRAEWVEAMFGCYKARAVPVNVNYRYVATELAYLLENSDSVAVVHERTFSPLLAEISSGLPHLRHQVVIEDGSEHDAGTAVSYEEALEASGQERDLPSRSAEDLYILYTGGTTGMPKGVLWRQDDIFFGAMGGGNFAGPPASDPEDLAGFVADDDSHGKAVITPPLMHGGAQWVSCIALFGGNTVVLYTSRGYDPHEIWSMVEREGATSVMVVGDAMGRPLAEALSTGSARYDTSTVKSFGSGGAILSQAVKEQLRQALPQAVVLDSFGASETGANGTVLDMGSVPAGPRFTMGPHTTVLDDKLEPITPGSGAVGRLARRGHIPLGYYKDAEKTAATFPVDPSGVRWVVPGDFATIEGDGSILVLGRGSVSINTGGEKVFPEEVEAALKSHPDVFDAIVVGIPDERFGERVAALVKPRAGADLAVDELADHCRGQIAGYKVPRTVRLMDEIVRTPVGKPDYRWAKQVMKDATSGEPRREGHG
jgi:3-oxocholest-4-en-26-oate---CoA ligase